jgi:nucleotide-binding universal stress UspA family protein
MDLDSPALAASSEARAEPASALTSASGGKPTRPRTARRVLVATDTRASSAGAERAGIKLAADAGASLIFISVIDPSGLQLPGGLFHTRFDQVRAQRESTLATLVATARQQGVAAQYLIWKGDPGVSVVEAAAAEDADIIVIGSHARGLVGRLLLGSVSAYVVTHGRRPVVVIGPGQELDDVWPP